MRSSAGMPALRSPKRDLPRSSRAAGPDTDLHRRRAGDGFHADALAPDRRAVVALRRSCTAQSDKTFRVLQLVSAAAYSLGHGTNDAQKTMGIIVALL